MLLALSLVEPVDTNVSARSHDGARKKDFIVVVVVFPSIGFFISIVTSYVAVRRFSNALATCAKAMLVEAPPIVIQGTRMPRATKMVAATASLAMRFICRLL